MNTNGPVERKKMNSNPPLSRQPPIPPVPIKFTSCLGHGYFGVVIQITNVDYTYSALKIIFNIIGKELERESLLEGKFHKNVVQLQQVTERGITESDWKNLSNLVKKNEEELLDQIELRQMRATRLKKPLICVCIKMELCGETLRNWLLRTYDRFNVHKNIDISLLEVNQLRIISDMIDGMSFLHGNKILHRDFKPENIMFSANFDSVKIGDFGISRILHSESSRSNPLTKDVGTTAYRAPEMGRTDYDLKSDLYSLGLVIWEVAQLIPFEERRVMFNNLVFDKNVDIVTTKLTPGISTVIVSLTMRKPTDRMNSIEELNGLKIEIEKEMLKEVKISSSADLKDFLSFCKPGSVIRLAEGIYHGPFIVKTDKIKIIGSGCGNTCLELPLSPTNTHPAIHLQSNDCHIKYLAINVPALKDGIVVDGDKNNFWNLSVIGGHRNIIVNGNSNEFRNLGLKNSAFGLNVKGNKNYFNIITLKDVSLIGFNLKSSDDTVIKNVEFRNVKKGIIIEGNNTKVHDMNYTITKPVFECTAIKIHGSRNEVDKLICTWEEKLCCNQGLEISKESSKHCKISNSVCGPASINGSSNSFNKCNFGENIEISGSGHSFIECKAGMFTLKKKVNLINVRDNEFIKFDIKHANESVFKAVPEPVENIKTNQNISASTTKTQQSQVNPTSSTPKASNGLKTNETPMPKKIVFQKPLNKYILFFLKRMYIIINLE